MPLARPKPLVLGVNAVKASRVEANLAPSLTLGFMRGAFLAVTWTTPLQQLVSKADTDHTDTRLLHGLSRHMRISIDIIISCSPNVCTNETVFWW